MKIFWYKWSSRLTLNKSCSNCFDWLKTWPPGGVASFSCVYIGNLIREKTLANVCLLVEFCPLISGRFLSILMDFHMQIATIRMGLSLIYLKGSQVDISKFICTSVLEYCIYHSKHCRPDLGLQCLANYLFRCFPIYKVLIPHYQTSLIKLYPWGQKWPVLWVTCFT